MISPMSQENIGNISDNLLDMVFDDHKKHGAAPISFYTLVRIQN